MYHIKPVVLISDGDIVHTDNMYKIGVSSQPVSIPDAADPTDQFASFLVNSSGARSKLGQALEAMGRHQGDEPEGSYQRAEKQTFRAVPHTEEFNEMNLDKYVIRKMGPVSKLGKYLHSQQESENHSHQDLGFLYRLKELERVLDSFLVPMGLVKSSEHVPSSLLANTKVSKPPIQPTKHIENPITAPISSFMTNLVSPCASTSMGHIDDNAKLVHRLKELDEVLDGLLVPMGLVKSGKHASSSQLMVSKVLESPTQPSKRDAEPVATPFTVPMTNMVSPCASPSETHIDDDAKVVNRLKGLDRVLDGLLGPMGLVNTSEHAPPSQIMDSKVLEPPTQPAKHVEEPATTSIP
ncbi:unnamed protein product, partial [Taenia asiatica]|uniref:Mediator complex subunit 1 n=1 Tax=Taenia asiatica TaxID=60517 RepID=A0A0R3VZI1_TAEAS